MALALCNEDFHENEQVFMKEIQDGFNISDASHEEIANVINSLMAIYNDFEKIISK